MAVFAGPRSHGGLLSDRRKPTPDVLMFVIMVALMALGVLMVYSATFVRLEAEGLDPTGPMRRQMIFAGVAIVAFVVASIVDYRQYRNAAAFLFVAVVLVLFAVLFMPEQRSAQRWIPIGTFQLQPSEFAKLGVIMVVATILAPASETGMRWARLIATVLVVSLPSFLIFRQPDLGTMMVFGFITLAMLFAAGTTFRQLLVLIGAGVAAVVAFWQLELLEDYQVNRILGFLDQQSALESLNYNLDRSRIAIGNGGLFGQGLFEGPQTLLNFVPFQTSDFIFTAIGEQLGFIGGALVVGAYGILIWRILVIANGALDRFGSLVAVGIATMLIFHVFINIGMTVGVAPVTGLPLPFISAGGSAMIAMGGALGIVNNIWRSRSPVPGREYVPLN
ncbi:MAG TPA: rod shape-determining protein RodA [Actinobacteria bacterium]|nr:rod shape-determining protein RodA [Actinomycetota bacterium]